MILAIVALLAGAWLLFRHSDRIYSQIRSWAPERQPVEVDPDDMGGPANQNQNAQSKFGQDRDLTNL